MTEPRKPARVYADLLDKELQKRRRNNRIAIVAQVAAFVIFCLIYGSLIMRVYE